MEMFDVRVKGERYHDDHVVGSWPEKIRREAQLLWVTSFGVPAYSGNEPSRGGWTTAVYGVSD